MDCEVKLLFEAYEAYKIAQKKENDCEDKTWNALTDARLEAERQLSEAFSDAVKAAICD